MFSEYASRFLAQSQSRLSFGQPDGEPNRNRFNRNSSDRRSSSRYATSRSFLSRQNMPSPYHPSASQTTRFPFGSRTLNPPPAPLFYSAADEFREEDDGEEYEREVADLHALQKSRRNFGESRLTESSEIDGDRNPDSEHEHATEDNRHDADPSGFGGRGIMSSWRGVRSTVRGRPPPGESLLQQHEERDGTPDEMERRTTSPKAHGKLVDVELTSASEGERVEASEEIAEELDDNPPSYQHFRSGAGPKRPRTPLRTTLPVPQETDEEALLAGPRPLSPDQASSPTVADTPEAGVHDPFWAQLFIICQCATLGASVLVFLQTSTPDGKKPLGDTIYTVLHKSFHLLGVYSVVSVVVGFLWLALLRSFVKPLIFLSLISVPVILFSFFLYPFISSYSGTWKGSSIQDRAMWWFSFIPCAVAVFWTYTVWKGRHSLTKATELLEFAGKILTAMSPLILVGIATLAAVILYTWMWMLMFTRLFLEGHFTSGTKSLFVIDVSTWWLAIAFFMNFLWTLGVFAGIQRATTAATVSQWYFHRNAVPRIPATVVVKASVLHAVRTMAGAICLSTLLALLVRLPLLILPRRLVSMFSLFIYAIVPASIAALTNPLTITYAAVHSQSLSTAARNLSQMNFVSKTRPTTTLNPGSFNSITGSTLLPYRLAKLLLHALRFIMSLALGFGGWVSTARMLQVADASAGYKGSLYAYVIGLIAAAIGWGSLGAMEGIIGGILDALVVCWGSEVGVHGFGEVRYCREAGQLLGDGNRGRWS